MSQTPTTQTNMIKDIKAQNENVKPTDNVLAKLHADFPQCFSKDGKFDIDKFQNLIQLETDITREGYDLNFLGKNYANLIACTETETVIQPDLEHNAQPENANSQNVYISGDNLDALKHLLKSYSGRVKCIYIDPPYNTGSDGFVYNDKFNFTTEQLQTKLGVSEEKAKRILDLCTRGSASHSAWLMFMAPRLMLARDLLSEDGVICISIDDNEQANLKLLCDSIFGEDNFESNACVVVNPGGRDYKQVAITNEYLLIYSNDEAEINEIPKDAPFQFKDSLGGYNCRELRNRNPKFNSQNRPNLFYPFFVNPNLKTNDEYCAVSLVQDESFNIEVMPYNSNGDESVWRWGMPKSGKNIVIGDLDKSQILAKQKQDGGWNIYEKNRKSTTKVKSLWGDKDDISMRTEDGTKEVRKLFGNKNIFDHPKPTELPKRVALMGATSDSIILDFFSGSASTAHAIMKLNSEDCGDRKYIVVQLPVDLGTIKNPNATTKNAIEFLKSIEKPHTLDQIGLERIRRAAAKIKSDIQEEIPQLEKQLKTKEDKLVKASKQTSMFEEENPLVKEIESLKAEIENKRKALETTDFGFKHYTLQNVDKNTLDQMEKFELESMFSDEDILQKFGKETVLETWCVKDGYGFGANVVELQLAKYTAYHCGSHLYFVSGECFDENAVIALIDKYNSEPSFNPQNIVLFGYSFTFTQTEMLRKNLNTLKDSFKNLNINIDVRY